MAELIEVTQESFETEVHQSTLPVLVDFWGPRCVPCLGLMPVVEELAARHAGKVKFCKVNCAENRRLGRAAQGHELAHLPLLQGRRTCGRTDR